MTNEEAIKQLEITKECDVDTVAQIKALDVAIAALRNHSVDTTKMAPLTLEQLREMDGRPVWIERIGSHSPEDKEWALVFCKEKFCRTSCGNIALFGCYGTGWLAYAYPAHIDREAWTAEWTVDEFGHKCSKCGEYLPDGEDVRKPQFCPECGRAMTPEAWAMLEKRLLKGE